MEPDALSTYLHVAVRIALKHEAFEPFRSWSETYVWSFLDRDPNWQMPVAPENRASFAKLVTRLVWQAVPLPSRGFKPERLPEPGRNDPCFCGSGAKYKHCCQRVTIEHGFPVTPDVLWPIVLQLLTKKELLTAAREHKLPPSPLAQHARHLADKRRAAEAAKLLEPLFEAPVRDVTADAGEAYQALCDVYDALDRPARKDALNTRLARELDASPLRSTVFQRMATILMDDGAIDEAWVAFEAAQRDNPRDPSLAILEVQLLMAQGRRDEAAARATFWARRLRRHGEAWMADLCEWLDRFAQDPDASMDEVARAAASEGALAALAWVESFAGRPIPLYGVQRLDDYRLARDPEQASDPEQPGGPEEPDEPEEPDDCVQIEGYALVGLEELAELEAEFEKALPVAEPWSVQDRGYAEADPWTDEEARRWLTILKTHPEAADSLAILDGVATALRELPELGQPWFADKVERPLLERAVAIVERAVARASADDERAANANAAAGVDAVAAVAARTHSPFHLPWIVLGNRPALRSLSRLCALCIAFGPAEEGLRLARRMLELNPADNHGWRATVINLELAAGRDAEALVLAQRYPDELTVDIAYGRALALFRLGRQEEATIALREGVDRLPLVPRYLATEGMRAPPLDDFTVTIGGKDQAWRYREDARALWLITPGAIDWLRKVAREAGGGGDRRVGGSKGAGGGKGKRER